MTGHDSCDEKVESVAVIGMAGRFPGAANIDEFWNNLKNGVDSIVDFSLEEVAAAGVDINAIKDDPNYIMAGGILGDPDKFDALFFGINPKEAAIIDPQHRLLLEISWQALEDAGYDPGNYEGAIGVFAGKAKNTYLFSNIDPNGNISVNDFVTEIGNETDYLATIISYKLGLKGPSVSIHTACSTSLVAVHFAKQSLLNYECDMAMAGGVSILLPEKAGYWYDEGNIMSSDGHTRTFDEKAKGTVFCNGAGLVVLKRLSDALSDGDNILAVIKGSAINNDGDGKVGFMAPSVNGQAEVIVMAQAEAEVESEDISYVETHGTATPLGDPIEIEALTQAFRTSTTKKGFCALGSVKANIGHLGAAAGISGLIKTILCLKHKIITPAVNFKKVNPKFNIKDTPFFINNKLREWKGTKGSLIAGITSLGAGGTNAHAILTERPPLINGSKSRPWNIISFSAKSEKALDEYQENIKTFLKNDNKPNLADVAYTLHVGRKNFNYRRTFICRDKEDGLTILDSKDKKEIRSNHCKFRSRAVSFMFPGQGSQYVNMGKELYESEPLFREQIDYCSEKLKPELSVDLRHIIYPKKENEKEATRQLKETSITQPAIFVIEYSLAKLWISWGIEPAQMIGHSIGEYVAACYSGVFNLDDALHLLAARGRLIQSISSGSMVAISRPVAEVKSLLPHELSIAAVNTPSNCVISGPNHVMDIFIKELDKKEIAARPLHTSHAFHSSMMDPILESFAEEVSRVDLRTPTIPFISSVSGTWITEAEAKDPFYWANHLRKAVQFKSGRQELANDPDQVLLEVGPGNTLLSLSRHPHFKASKQKIFASLPHPREKIGDGRYITDTLSRLWLEGVPINWIEYFKNEKRMRVSLPTYPFQRKSFWIGPAKNKQLVRGLDNKKAITQNPLEENIMAGTKTPQEKSSRKPNILKELKELLTDLSGIEPEDLDSRATFIELGFDSLFLTQISQAIKKRFKTRITLRLLLEGVPSLDDLTNYLDDKLPPEAFAPAPITRETNQTTHGNLVSNSLEDINISQDITTDGQSSLVERVISQQLEMMNRQLELLKNPDISKHTSTLVDTVKSHNKALQKRVQSIPSIGILKDSKGSDVLNKTDQTEKGVKQFGPYKPLEPKQKRDALTPHQRKHLEALISRYEKRTQKSKQMAQKHRSHFADPRSVAGFQMDWKEITYPVVIERSLGTKMWDVDGNEWLDVTMGFGTMLFGHSPPFVVRALENQLKKGIEIGPQSSIAGEVSELICEFTGMERVTFANTGSEAVLGAIRVARTVTGRDKVVMFAGDYHGITDEVLVRSNAVNGVCRPFPIAPGIPKEKVQNVLVLEYGNPESLKIIESEADNIAAVILEPVQARMPELQPRDFLHSLRKLTETNDIALIFDEVIMGFRIHPGGAQAWFDVKADIAIYGKVIGGGIPIGVIAGKSKFMDAFDGGMWQFGDDSMPEAGVTFFAGTFVRHPLAMAASLSVLKHLKENSPRLQEQLNLRTNKLAGNLNKLFEMKKIPIRVTHFASMCYFANAEAMKYYSLMFHYLRDKGVHIWEGRCFFLSTAHTDKDIDFFIQAFKETIDEMQQGGFLEPVDTTSTKPDKTSDIHIRAIDDTQNLPLTEAQMEIWLASSFGKEASCAFNESCRLILKGHLDIDKIKKAIQKTVERHSSLRTVFSAGGVNQRVLPSLVLDIPVADISSLPEDMREEKISEALHDEVIRPFDLKHGPLIRTQILKLGDREHILIITAHHIVCDGWSYDVMVIDLSKLYSMECENTIDRRDPPMQMSEYISWIEGVKNSPECESAKAYWLEQFSGTVPVLDLPIDHQRPPIKTYSGARMLCSIDTTVYKDIKQFGLQHGCTLFSTLLAAYTALLHHLTGQDDIVVGIPAAGQQMLESHDLVGHCTNLLPMRLRINGEKSFNDLLKSVKSMVLDAFENQIVTYGTLLNKLNIPRDPSRTPLVSTMFNIDPAIHGLEFAGLDVDFIANPRCGYQFDFGFNLSSSKNDLLVGCDYNTDLFEPDTIKRWVKHYETLLKSIISNADQHISDLKILSDRDKEQQLVDWNKTASKYQKNKCIHHCFEAQVKETPDAVAVIFNDNSLSYRKLNEQANQLAHHLQSIGVGPGVFVGIYLERSLEMMAALFGIMKAGGAYVPLDPDFPQERLEFMLQDADIFAIVTQEKFSRVLPAANSVRRVYIDSDKNVISEYGANNPTSAVHSENLAYLIYTSGSTGKPKGVQLPHRAIVNFLHSMAKKPGISRTDRLLSVTTLSFDIAVLELFLPVTKGACTVIVSRDVSIDAKLLADSISHYAPNVMQATPSTWRMLLEVGWKSKKRLKALVGGEALPRDLCEALLSQGIELWNMYGPTETCVWSTVKQIKPNEEFISIGTPIANTQAYICNQNLELVPIGVSGELLIGGDGLAKGYLNRPELTAEKFIPNHFTNNSNEKLYKTGDLARYMPDGSIECLGRTDSQVKIRGFRIELGEIENVLLQFPSLLKAAAVVREDIPGDKQLVAYIVGDTKNGGGTAFPRLVPQLRDFLREKLPHYMIPSPLVILDTLPLTPNGKIDRLSLPAPDRTKEKDGNDSFVAPHTPMEVTIAEIWSNVLNIENIGVHDNFFDMGGHSLLAIRIVSRVYESLGIELSLLSLFENPTVELQSHHVETLQSLAVETPADTSDPLTEREEFEI